MHIQHNESISGHTGNSSGAPPFFTHRPHNRKLTFDTRLWILCAKPTQALRCVEDTGDTFYVLFHIFTRT